jgi:hypothetical protein
VRDSEGAGGAVFAAVSAASFAGVYLQVSLMRLTSVMYYSAFVYAIIGVALLGYGAAGSVLAGRRDPPAGHPAARLGRWLAAFAAVVVPAFLAVNAVELPAHVLFGSLRGVPVLLLTYALLTVPFFLLGLGIAGTFAAYAGDVNRLYFADLVGAGAGSALAVVSLPWLGGVPLVAVAGAVGAMGAVCAFGAAGASRRPALVVGAADLLLLGVFLAADAPAVHIAPDKHGPVLARAAKPGGLDLTYSRWSAFGRVDVTEPFATLPPQFGGDVSPLFMARRIEQRMLMLDGAAPAFLYRVDGAPADLEFLAATSQSPAHRLRPAARVLVIGVGGATDVLIALAGGARHVVGVELNPITAHAVRDVYGSYVGHVLSDARVELVVAEGRNFAARDRTRYDVIQLSGVDTGTTHGAYGLGTMPESFVYTVEALQDLLARLAPGGVLSITRDLQLGWALRLVSVARAALLAEGLDPGARLAVLKGMGYGWATVLVKREPFTGEEAVALREFATRWRFPLLYDPLAGGGDPQFERLVRGGPGDEGDLELRPSTDDWPFFFVTLRWSRLPRMLVREPHPLANPLVFLVAFLSVNLLGLALLAVALIGWPLWRLRAAWRETPGKGAAVGYFAALGAGFILVEVALMQRFTVFLGNPALAVATVLAALLVSSGLGSLAARARRGLGVLPAAVAAIVVGLLVYASPLLPALLRALMWAPLGARLALSVLLVALVGFPMGMPFPAGLGRVAERAAPFVPWAWGINGMLSVIASLAGYLLGMAAGYTAMFCTGAALYAAALALSRRL